MEIYILNTKNKNNEIYYIYKITNKINGKVYIGKTNDIDKRWATHQKMAKKHINRYLYDAMNCYGIDNFQIEIIEECSKSDSNNRERFFIALYDSTNKEKGYNMTNGGDGGDTWSNNPNKVQISKKISEIHKGYQHTEEAKNKMRECALRRPPMSKETRNKISINLKKFYIEHPDARGKNNHMRGKYGALHPFYGKHHTLEARKKISLARQGKSYSEIFDDEETIIKLKEILRLKFTGSNNPKYKEINLKTFEELCMTDMTIKEIAEYLGITGIIL